jgi:hypothetical protein
VCLPLIGAFGACSPREMCSEARPLGIAGPPEKSLMLLAGEPSKLAGPLLLLGGPR